MKLAGDDPLDVRPRRLTLEQRGTLILAIEQLARVLADDDPRKVGTVRTLLAATFPRKEGVGVEHDPRSDRWYIIGADRERLHGPYDQAPHGYEACTGHRDEEEQLVHDGETCPIHEGGDVG